jgi:hypothetical protein
VSERLDTGKSLNTLLGWKKDPGPYATSLVERVSKLCDLPLKDLKWPDIRVLIGQNIGLKYLMPWAIDAVTKRPLYRAELFDGDLLVACLKVDGKHWVNNMEQWHSLKSILDDLDSAMNSVGEARVRFENEVFQAAGVVG